LRIFFGGALLLQSYPPESILVTAEIEGKEEIPFVRWLSG